MLLALRIQNFTVVEETEVAFGPGLTVLTGETGAGKSILVDALGLLLGARADVEALRAGADEAVVEALVQRDAELSARLEALGLPDTGEEVSLRRVVQRSGRGKVHVNGALATVSQLAQLLRGLVDVAGQHGQVGLFEPAAHRALLDGIESVAPALVGYRAAHAALAELEGELSTLGGDDRTVQGRLDFLAFQIDEVDRLDPGEGEDAALEEERRRLLGVERLRSAGLRAHALLTDEESGARDTLGRATAALEEAVRWDRALGSLASALRGGLSELEDAAHGLQRYLDGLEADPARLAAVEERLDALHRLCRKHGTDLAGVLRRRSELTAERLLLAGREERRAVLAVERTAREARAWELARVLRGARERAAADLQRRVRRELAALALPRARFAVQVAPMDVLHREGADQVEFLFSANPGEPPRPLGKVASGGEASRLLLALKRTLVGGDGCRTYVLDEADAGVSGAVADVVGRMIREVSRGRQVLCITHLPQVAAHADAHLHVEKTSVRGRVSSTVTPLAPGAPRTVEIARMLSGAHVTPEAHGAAEALVRAAQQGRPVILAGVRGVP